MTSGEPQLRGERLVKKVLEVVLQELARVGYGALSIEEVAALAGVNKTTIYRRWPTKSELVHDACLVVADEVSSSPDTGSLREDLMEMLRRVRDLLQTPRGQSLMRLALVEGGSGELARLARAVRDTEEAIPKRVIARAVQRGELPRSSDPALIVDTLIGAIQNRILFMGEKLTDRQLGALVDLVLLGATQGGARRSLRPATPR